MNRFVLFSLACTAALPAPAFAAKAVSLSWAKPGVSFESYRADALECGRAGYYLDVSGTEAAKVFQRASARLEANEAAAQNLSNDGIFQTIVTSAQIVHATRPDQRTDDVRQLMQGTVNGCLVERGYRPFKLTEAQKKDLRRLHYGSEQRRAYLYRLASDPEILGRQALPVVLKDVDPAQVGK